MSLMSEFLKLFKEHGLEWFHRYYSVYPAIVVSNQDPEKRGRIRVTCPTVMGTDRVLAQWAEPIDMKGASAGAGEFNPPYPNQLVHVMFEQGDVNYPVYMGGYYAQNELGSDFTASYPNVRGWVFKAGHKLLFDETPGAEVITLLHKSGSSLKMNSDGSITLQSPGKVNVNAGGDATVKAGGDVDVTAGGNAKIVGSMIILNSQGSGVTTFNSHLGVIDLITGVPVMQSMTVFADI